MKILFMGRKRVAADCLQHLCTLPGVEVVGVLTDSHMEVSVTSEVAQVNGVPILDHNETSGRLERGELAYDLGLSG
jgi:methionyl-tRNA formyltransferase